MQFPYQYNFSTMKSPLASHNLIDIHSIKEKLFLEADPYTFVSPSAYDTAWLAMIPDFNKPNSTPLFKNCLQWVLSNQKEEGFWGDYDIHGYPNIECIPASLACIAALRQWNIGHSNIEKGIDFIQTNAKKFLDEINNYPRWFIIVFPGMIEVMNSLGIEIVFLGSLEEQMRDILCNREQILDKEELVDIHHYPPLLSYLEVLPSRFIINKDVVTKNLSDDGSLFQSPAATACAYMITKKKKCLNYIQSIVGRCLNGVPPTYPMDEELIKLSLINQIEMLGLAEHFNEEIDKELAQAYRNYANHTTLEKSLHLFASELYKDTLAFWLLRKHGYSISPWSFCWYLQRGDIQHYLKNNNQYFSSLILNIHRATDVMFAGEHELEKSRSFTTNLLQKALEERTLNKCLHSVVTHELQVPWCARLEHLEYRIWIEIRDNNTLWIGKNSSHRLLSFYNDKLIQLAIKNYETRQFLYKKELEEVKAWSNSTGLSNMGFGRDKITYSYFAIASSGYVPFDSEIRMIIAKSAIIVIVADDFYDTKGSLHELESLTSAVERWDAKGLHGHSKTIFDALYGHVNDLVEKNLQQNGHEIANDLRYIVYVTPAKHFQFPAWYETFNSWLTEAKWSKGECIPSMVEYLKNGMVSVATHTMVLSASCLLNPSVPYFHLKIPQYQYITRLLMATTRLLNDVHSYQRELEEGSTNSVLLYMKENPDKNIEESVAYVKEILDRKKKEFIEHVLKDGLNDMPKPFRDLHLSYFKAFHMFYNTSNRFDSDTDVLEDIEKAIFIPLDVSILSKRHNPVEGMD